MILDRLPGKDFPYYYDAVKRGFNGGDWLGEGLQNVVITSSAAANSANHETALAIVDNMILGLPTFGGRPVNQDSILIKYTYYGDLNINGQVDADDLTPFAINFGRTTGATQINGDINFDGDVDADDLTRFAINFGLGIGNPLSTGAAAAVPEPATLAFGLAALAIAAVARIATRSCRA